ncbi:MAG: AEC family transporter [Clostridiales bacterium]|nr:MAG: AEC family transporter [Clostridiales bacterium]
MKRTTKNAVRLFRAIFRSNFIIFGMPVAMSLCNPEDIGSVSLLIAVIAPTFNVLAVITMEIFRGSKINVLQIIKGVITNPLIIASALGLIFLQDSAFKFRPFLNKCISDITKITNPLALILLGASFTFGSVKGYTKELIAGLLGRLVIVPAIFLPLAAALGFRGGDMVALMVLFASPAAVSSFIMAEQMEGDGALAGQLIVLGSVFVGFHSFFIWILILKRTYAYISPFCIFAIFEKFVIQCFVSFILKGLKKL